MESLLFGKLAASGSSYNGATVTPDEVLKSVLPAPLSLIVDQGKANPNGLMTLAPVRCKVA